MKRRTTDSSGVSDSSGEAASDGEGGAHSSVSDTDSLDLNESAHSVDWEDEDTGGKLLGLDMNETKAKTGGGARRLGGGGDKGAKASSKTSGGCRVGRWHALGAPVIGPSWGHGKVRVTKELLVPCSRYQFRVRAHVNDGWGWGWGVFGASSEPMGTAAGRPNRVERPVSMLRAAFTVTIAWKVPLANGTAINMYRVRWARTDSNATQGSSSASPRLSEASGGDSMSGSMGGSASSSGSTTMNVRLSRDMVPNDSHKDQVR